MTDKPKFLTALQVAERYGLTVDWVYGCKELQQYKRKVGKYVMYAESDLEKFEDYREQWPRTPSSGKKPGSQGYPIKQRLMRLKQESTEAKKNKPKRFKLKFDIKD